MKRAFKLATSSLVALGVVVGATVVEVSCGTSASYSLGTYANDYVMDPVGWSGKQDKELIVWLSYQKDQKQQVDKLTPEIERILTENTGYSVTYVDNSSVNYESAANTLSTKFQSGDYATLPDVIINYPDIQAILECTRNTQVLEQDCSPKVDEQPELSARVYSWWTRRRRRIWYTLRKDYNNITRMSLHWNQQEHINKLRGKIQIERR